MLRLVTAGAIWLLPFVVSAQENRTAIRTIEHPHTVCGIAFTPDGTAIAGVAGKSRLCVWDVSTGQLLATRRLLGKGMGVGFSPDGKKIAVTTKEKSDYGHVRLFDIRDGWSFYDQFTYGEQPGSSDVLSTGLVKFSPDGKTVASQLSGWGPVTLWHLENGRSETYEHPDADVARNGTGASDFVFSQDGGRLYVSWARRGIRVLSIQDREWHELGGLRSNSMDYSPNGRWLGEVLTVSGTGHSLNPGGE